MANVLDGAPRSLRESLPDAPVALEGVIAKCLQKQREHRYPNVAALANALLPFAPPRGRLSVERIEGVLRASGIDATERSSGAPSGREAAAGAATRASWGGTHAGTRRAATPSRVVLAGGGIMAMLGVSWFVLSRPAAPPEPLGGPATTGLAAAGVPVGPSQVSTERPVVEPIDSVAIPAPSAAPEPARSRRKARVAGARSALPTVAPSARLEPAPPPLSGGTFEDRK